MWVTAKLEARRDVLNICRNRAGITAGARMCRISFGMPSSPVLYPPGLVLSPRLSRLPISGEDDRFWLPPDLRIYTKKRVPRAMQSPLGPIFVASTPLRIAIPYLSLRITSHLIFLASWPHYALHSTRHSCRHVLIASRHSSLKSALARRLTSGMNRFMHLQFVACCPGSPIRLLLGRRPLLTYPHQLPSSSEFFRGGGSAIGIYSGISRIVLSGNGEIVKINVNVLGGWCTSQECNVRLLYCEGENQIRFP
jgi:hypothetical protein